MDKSETLRIIRNFLRHMPKTYRRRNANWAVVRDIIQSGTSHAGMTSSIARCRDIGIDPDGYTIEAQKGREE